MYIHCYLVKNNLLDINWINIQLDTSHKTSSYTFKSWIPLHGRAYSIKIKNISTWIDVTTNVIRMPCGSCVYNRF